MNDMYAWCFDHGRMHSFPYLQAPWCTAAWVAFPADTPEEALTQKKTAYGEAVFLGDLPQAQQCAVYDTLANRRNP